MGYAPRPPVVPSPLYQTLRAPVITIAIFPFLQNERGILQAKNAANCSQCNFSIVLKYSGGFAARLNILVCNPAHKIRRLDIPELLYTFIR